MIHFDAEREIQARQIRNRIDEIRSTIYGNRVNITDWQFVVTGAKKGPEPPPEGGWQPFSIGTEWGGYDVTVWFKAVISVPAEMGGEKVVALLKPGGESLAYLDGKPIQGLDGNRDELLLCPCSEGGEQFELMLEAYSHARFDQKHVFQYADLAALNEDVRQFALDAQVAYEVSQILPEGSALRIRMMSLIDNCVKMVDLQHVAASRKAAGFIGDERYFDSISRARQKLQEGLKEFQNSYGVGNLVLTGHSHIDTAWLWPLRETQRKCGRTFSTVLKYMEEYPEYHFSQSQPQLYEYTKRYYPDIYEKIKERVKEGRWEAVGATWVEQDSNISSGESLVRQLLYGNRFFGKEFGIRSRTCWLPDAFGFTWALPQILRKAGVDFFVTTKIDWSQYTKFPYSLFMWRGIDGTEILAMMPPLNYNGNPTPENCLKQWNLFKQKEQCDEVIFSYGYGDGGGGPTKGMLEYGKRLENMVGVPKCSFGRVQDYFDKLEREVDYNSLPVWNGELYLELHRACQTTQGRTKRNNRKSELLYRDAEMLASFAHLAGNVYPQEKLYEGWKIILCNQFHDILPGSSIGEVYEDADRDYAKVLQEGKEVRDDAIANLEKLIDTKGEGKPILVINTLSWRRSDVASITVDAIDGDVVIADEKGEPVPTQVIKQNNGKMEILFRARDIPPLGYSVYRLVTGQSYPRQNSLSASPSLLENSRYRITIDETGALTSLYDKMSEREVLPEGERANVLQLFDDRPHAHDAWDIDFNYAEKMWEMSDVESIEVVETGPARASLRVTKSTEKSRLVQYISIYDNLPRIDFETHVDWHEKRTLLKVAFPVDILSSRATYEIQFGNIERPTHFNTDWDRAKFEVPAQKWVDLSEGDYGVSLLNDCKYGHDVHDNVLRLSLLRSPVSPDRHADEGEHNFTYSLLPHAGDWRKGNTIRRAHELNSPLITRLASPHPGNLPATNFFAEVLDNPNVIIDTIKKAEEGDAIITRIYEAYGQRGDVKIRLNYKPNQVTECNLMEEEDKPVALEGNELKFYLKPYEIKTFKLVF